MNICINFARYLSSSNRSFKIVSHVKGTFEHANRHAKDPYVKQRVKDAYRCRSAYKLIQIDDKHEILTPGSVVVDLGAAPGAWSQVIAQRVLDKESETGAVVAVDLQRIPPLEGVETIQGDFTSKDVLKKIVEILKKKNLRHIDAVVCDAAPFPSAIKSLDHDRIINLVTVAAMFSFKTLQPGGTFLCKVLDGDRTKMFTENLLKYFASVHLEKPDASRKDSSEKYVLCKGFKGKRK